MPPPPRNALALELAGLGLDEFMAFAAGREVPLHYTVVALDQDRQTAAQLER